MRIMVMVNERINSCFGLLMLALCFLPGLVNAQVNAGNNSLNLLQMLQPTSGKDAPVVNPKRSQKKSDTLKNREVVDVEKSELELKRLQIQKDLIVLERELEELMSLDAEVTPQDSLNISIKKENLKLLYLKEQILLKEQLKQLGGLRDYGLSKVYGHHFFRDGGIKFFQKATDATPSNSYILGPSDKLHIEIWGYSNLSTDIEIGSDGYANLPYGQKVFLRGINLESARQIIRKKFSSMVDLKTSTLDISIVKFRTITVHIVGEVFKPGSYVIPAINTAFNALTVMGGPTDIGTVRNIYIKRDGRIVDSLDAYDYMLNPKKSREIYLQDNDYIIVEPIGKVVTVKGALKRSGSYELKKNEKLDELVTIAAGIFPTTYLKDVLVTRVRENKYYEQISLNYDSLLENNQTFDLLDGDLLEFKVIKDDAYQLLVISGAVNIPGIYKVSKGASISGLVKQANGLLKEAYLSEAYLIRTNEDFTKSFISFNLGEALKDGGTTIDVQPFDEIHVFSLKDYLLIGNVSIKGAVREPQKMAFAEDMSLRDLIFIAGGLKPESYLERAVLIRTNEQTKEKQTIIFNVDEVVNNANSNNNLLLQRNDEVEIFSKIEFRDDYTIDIMGEVHTPGSVPFSTNMTLKDLIFKSGGLKTSAINSKIEIVRSFRFGEDMIKLEPIPAEIIVIEIGAVLELKKEFEDFILYPFDQITVRKNPYYLETMSVTLTGAVVFPGEYTLLGEDERLTSVIKRAGGLRSYAFSEGLEFNRGNEEDGSLTSIITNLEKAMKKPKSIYNYILRDKDEIHIPIADYLVAISGNIMNEDKERLSIYYKKHRRAKYYITHYAGGFKERSMKRKTYIKYADGTAKRTRNFVLFKVYPKPKRGSEIFVIRNNKVKKKKGLGEGFGDATTKITALLTLLLTYTVIQNSFK